MSPRQAALALACNGWQVLPLHGKVPLTRHGVDDASSRPAQVERWWRRWPDANIGGRVPPGLVVIDIDPRNGGAEGWRTLSHGHEVPATLTTISGRGDGGMHLYFARPAGSLNGRGLPPGIDLKANGYCVLPPSLHPDTGRPYRWGSSETVAAMPGWLRQVVRPAKCTQLARTRLAAGQSSPDALVRFVAEQAPGNRNSALYWAACRLDDNGRLDDVRAGALIEAAVRAGESLDAARRTVASAKVRRRR